MTAAAIEAKSLSALTSLASNPPAYPRNPTHVRNEPLVLYIARVPGSRDVFLTPMKPRDKVVTAEDIQSSLYFVHVDQPEDAQLVTPLLESGLTEQYHPHPDRPPVSQIQRKAIPTTLAPPGMPAAPRRKPLPGTLGARNDFENRQNISAGIYSQPQSQPPLPPPHQTLGPQYSQRRSFDSSRLSGEENLPSLPPRRPIETSPPGTTLTLIRRDPASSAQWNVARIEDPPVIDVSSSSINSPGVKKKIGAPVYIDVTNPGYSKFLTHSAQPNLDAGNRDSSAGAPMSTNTLDRGQSTLPPSYSDTNGEVDVNQGVFRRRLWMEGSKYSNGGFGHRKINSQDSNVARHSPRGSFEAPTRDRLSVDGRTQGLGIPSSMGRDDQTNSSLQVSDRQAGFRGYVFSSPWNGRCEFITGAGGGSLKCRHIVPGLQGAPPMAMPVSELRFNLPSSSKSSTPMDEETSKRSSFFHRPRNHRNYSSVSEMDLSLGQEVAGGGFGGKQAKLGKLIIDDEGLKMLDLLVAANIALWWRAYEKGRNDV